jgi:hypothetical protein
LIVLPLEKIAFRIIVTKLPFVLKVLLFFKTTFVLEQNDNENNTYRCYRSFRDLILCMKFWSFSSILKWMENFFIIARNKGKKALDHKRTIISSYTQKL